ncbi:MAG: 3-isopropylmalate dehydratase small subunit [Chloroflexi bacterium]|nr:MAG: 3-isopropylmalate dehydratase small subunit [Chloroflexota bacterium]
MTALTGRCWKFGDNVPTDAIVRSDLVFGSMSEMVAHALEHLNPRFPGEVRPGDVLVAGRHFGQSSGRAIAARVLKAAGVSCVVAETFARTFYRNGFEIGLPLLECPGVAALVEDGDVLGVDVASGEVVNETRGGRLRGRPTSPFLLEMLAAGGLIPLAARLAEEG